MNGPEHYRVAEELLQVADEYGPENAEVMNCVAAAQVHATLALAAATFDATDDNPRNLDEWSEATRSHQPKGGDR